jgi:hypothetical protein
MEAPSYLYIYRIYLFVDGLFNYAVLSSDYIVSIHVHIYTYIYMHICTILRNFASVCIDHNTLYGEVFKSWGLSHSQTC